MIDEYLLFVGIDWATEEHTICILDRDQKIVEERAIKHSGTGLAQLEELLVKLNPGEPARVAVAIEVPRGAGAGAAGPGSMPRSAMAPRPAAQPQPAADSFDQGITDDDVPF